MLVGGVLIGLAIDRDARPSWPPTPCVVQGLEARCGSFVVPENRTTPNGRTIGLQVVVLPASLGPSREDAVAYLAGGPGSAATQDALDQGWQSSTLTLSRDLLLVDQRGTGRSKPRGGDVTRYGTRMAMDDLDAVRAALGYRQLDLIGSSYGATAAQVYARLHPAAARTLVLLGGTAIDVPFFGRYAANAQHALDRLATLCKAEPDCRRVFPGWRRGFDELVKAWNVRPVNGTTGDELASVVQRMLLDLRTAVSIPLVVSSAAKGDYAPLEAQGVRDLDVDLGLMGSIWCNEPWTGLDARGPWGTDFDSLTIADIRAFRKACSSIATRAEPRSLWTLPTGSRVPVLAFAGGADPQDPVANLSDLRRHFPDSRTVVFPHLGHTWWGVGGCLDRVVTDFVERGTTKGLDTTSCDGAVVVPPFALGDRPSSRGPDASAAPATPTRCGDDTGSRTERVNVSGVDHQTTKPVLRATLSADGRFVAFSSGAATLVPGDRNRVVDVFVRDVWRRRTTRVSVSSSGVEGNGASFFPSISGDGRFVAFRSFARNLVRGDRNRVEDVFVHDRLTGSTERVSVATNGAEANGPSVSSSIDGDGSVVLFSSDASNLVPNDRNAAMDVFVRDRARRRTIRVSVGSGGEANGRSEGSGVSRSGRAVVFRSLATNLVRGDTNGFPDVFVRNWVAERTTRVDLSSRGGQANHETYRGSISGDGRRVGFRSEARNLVPHDTNTAQDVFVYDRPTGTIRRISVSTRGGQAYAPPSRRTARGHRFVSRPFLSATGRFVAFGSFAANLVHGDTNRVEDVFLRDLELGRTIRVSVGSNGAQANGGSQLMGISADGAVVLFASSASNLVRGDTNGSLDAFVRVRRACPAP